MLSLKTETLELRGLKNETSKKGNLYYIIFCETACGEPHKFFCKNSEAFPSGLKKGDNVILTLTYNSFKELEVLKVEKAEV